MTWHRTTDPAEFEAAAGGLLRARPVANTIPLTLLENLRIRGRHAFGEEDPFFGWYSSGGTVTGAFVTTPPWPVLVAAAPADSVAALADVIADRTSVNAELTVADALEAEWRRRTGGNVTRGRESRLFRLDVLTPPDPAPPGSPRLAGPDDQDPCLHWYELFAAEIGESDANAAAAVADRIGYGGIVLWEVDGVPVSLAGRNRPAAGVTRVGPVFTPAEHRNHGYAAAVTAEITQHALDLDTEVVLFTDLANPTTNALYPRLGYRPLEDRVVISRVDGEAGTLAA